ncbi:ribose 5-phosphate isomerase B [Clostridium hydrogeniformans]|uniref:ribose 5-phosphate isomerase B n=1 Tax=Clostridium hydrogeniformans TaxID=349933 RepID=UPI0004889B4F|nr:ribose 5-phosphate isomerase B [Clostridium hydrogeniformans]
MKIAIGSDHGGFKLKSEIIKHLEGKGIDVKDFGTYSEESCDYPDIALAVGEKVSNKDFDFGILICGTGIGISIAANKVKGVRAALCSDTFSAHATREHNNANILALGERVVGPGLALDIVDTFLNAKFQGDRHIRRINKITDIEIKYSK